jgi:hypothetical protein
VGKEINKKIMINSYINIAFLLFIALVPLFGLFGYLWLPKPKKRYRIYLIALFSIIILYLFDIQFIPQITNVIIGALFFYILSEFLWLSLKLNNKVLKILFPVLGILLFLLISSFFFIVGIAGGRLFSQFEILSKQHFGIFRYEIVKYDFFDTGNGWSIYKMNKGLRFIPLDMKLSGCYGGKGIRDVVDKIEWEKVNNTIVAKLYADGNLSGTLSNEISNK